MGLLSRALVSLGLLLLAHAGYSAHELSLLTRGLASSASSAATTTASHGITVWASALHFLSGLPPDITLETLVSVLLVSAGMVLASEPLKPITWSVWAGEIEREGGHQNPFRAYEDRLGFWDVRTKRKEFADWVRSDGDGDGEKLACTSAAAKSM